MHEYLQTCISRCHGCISGVLHMTSEAVLQQPLHWCEWVCGSDLTCGLKTPLLGPAQPPGPHSAQAGARRCPDGASWLASSGPPLACRLCCSCSHQTALSSSTACQLPSVHLRHFILGILGLLTILLYSVYCPWNTCVTICYLLRICAVLQSSARPNCHAKGVF